MAINASFGAIGKIRICPAGIKKEKEKANKYSNNNKNRELPLFRWKNFKYKSHKLIASRFLKIDLLKTANKITYSRNTFL